MSYVVVVADRLSEAGLELLRGTEGLETVVTAGEPDRLVPALATAHALIVRSGTTVTEELITAAPQLSVIGRAGVGVDNIDLDAATRRGIAVLNVPGANTVSAAEHSVALLLALLRRIPWAAVSMREGAWDRKRFPGTELRGKRLGVVGLGRVGLHVAGIGKAFGMRVMGSDPYLPEQSDVQALGGQEEFAARLASNNLTEEEYREQVRSNLMAQNLQMQLPIQVPETAEHVHARHILVATEEEAQAILDQLENGADFDTLARTFSLDVSTRDRGGDLGFFPKGLLLTPELEEAAFDLAPGQISGIIHSDLLGYHIIQVLEREERAVSEQDRALIQANQLERWREELWANAVIERFVEP